VPPKLEDAGDLGDKPNPLNPSSRFSIPNF
jgi:hypothetical protein